LPDQSIEGNILEKIQLNQIQNNLIKAMDEVCVVLYNIFTIKSSSINIYSHSYFFHIFKKFIIKCNDILEIIILLLNRNFLKNCMYLIYKINVKTIYFDII